MTIIDKYIKKQDERYSNYIESAKKRDANQTRAKDELRLLWIYCIEKCWWHWSQSVWVLCARCLLFLISFIVHRQHHQVCWIRELMELSIVTLHFAKWSRALSEFEHTSASAYVFVYAVCYVCSSESSTRNKHLRYTYVPLKITFVSCFYFQLFFTYFLYNTCFFFCAPSHSYHHLAMK